VVRAEYTHPGNSGHNYSAELVQVFEEFVQAFVGEQQALLHTDFF
jgi:hypothetical protein